MERHLKILLSSLLLWGLLPFAAASVPVGLGEAHTAAAVAGEDSPATSRHGVFQEPLLPLAPPAAQDSQALEAAIAAYRNGGDAAAVEPLQAYLEVHPQSPWRAALLLNMALARQGAGYFTEAITLFENAYRAAGSADTAEEQALAARALGELLSLHTRFGHAEAVERWLAEVPATAAIAAVTEQVATARSGLWQMRNTPGDALRCGLESLGALLVQEVNADPSALFDVKAGPRGTDLAQLQSLARRQGQQAEAVRREDSQPIPVPSIMHLHQGHFATILREQDGRYEVFDPAYGERLWLTRDAIDAESSGHFLVLNAAPKATLQPWQMLTANEAAKVIGAGNTSGNVVDQTSQDDHRECDNDCESDGMPRYRVHSMLVSLNIVDTPVRYKPSVGPAVAFRLSYSQREAYQPTTFSFSNLGPKWLHNWQSYIEDDPQAAGSRVRLFLPGGGSRGQVGYAPGTGAFSSEQRTGAQLVRTASTPIRYERRMPDGSVLVYGQSDGNAFYPRRIFLTEVVDSAGNAVTLQYDIQHRLTGLVDALGQLTALHYDNHAKPLLITGVTDPFGRSVVMGYDASGRLNSITDAEGLTATFTYDSGTFITAMTTPYGTTSFASGQSGTTRWVEITDPKGERERVEYRHGASGIPFSDGPVPVGMNLFNQYINSRNTFYWDKEAMRRAPGNHAQARIRHWLHLRTDTSQTTGVLESTKNPLERRTWYNYPGQGWAGADGSFDRPSIVGRVLPDGTTQLKKYSYNSQGNLAAEIDPVGRETRYNYAPNGIDLTRVSRKTATGFETLAEFTYNDQHRPLTYIDADGQVTTYSYSADGQLLTVTNPLGQTAVFDYDGNGFLQGITDANGVRQVSYTYDLIGRKASESNAAGYRLEYGYDNLNRLTQIRYPDGTEDTFSWDRLDLVTITDRYGSSTQHSYDDVRNRIGTENASGHTVAFDYFANGKLKSVTGGKGNTTAYERDIQGRIIKSIRPDGKFSQTLYDSSGRQSAVVDALNGTARFDYAGDDKLASISDPKGGATQYIYHPYTGDMIEQDSPDTGKTVFQYDIDGNPTYKQDANGNITQLAYDVLNRIKQIDYSDDQFLAYSYDSGDYGKGRLTAVAGGDSLTTLAYDQNGDISERSQSGPDGSPLTVKYRFTPFGQLAQIIYPSGAVVDYGYHQDRLISIAVNGKTVLDDIHYEPFGPIKGWRWGNGQIHERAYDAAGLLVSHGLGGDTRDLTYTPVNNIQRISDSQRDQNFVYDFLDRLTEAQGTHATPALNYRLTYSYDANGNRIDESDNGVVTSYGIDSTSNRLVSINGELQTLDANGNLINDGTHSYGYDARNRLVSVDNGNTARYRYNGFGERIYKQGLERYQLTADLNGDGLVTSEDIHVLDDLIKAGQHPGYADLTQDGVVDKKDNACIATMIGDNTRKKAVPPRCRTGEWVETEIETTFVYEGPNLLGEYTPSGEAKQEIIWLGNTPVALLHNGEQLYIHADHLGAPVAITADDTANTVVWRWDRRPFGDTLADEDPDGDGTPLTFNLRLPGQYYDRETGLHYNYFRDYDPSTGRYAQSDPIGLNSGINTYVYVRGDPLGLVDPFGLETTLVCRPVHHWLANLLGGVTHCAVIVWHWEEGDGYDCSPGDLRRRVIDRQYSLAANPVPFSQGADTPTYNDDTNAFNNPGEDVSHYPIFPPIPYSQQGFDRNVIESGDNYSQGPYGNLTGPNSNTAADNIIEGAGGTVPEVPRALHQDYGE